MSDTELRFGYRIVGNTWEARRVVDAAAALAGYAACDDRAEVHREAYLSAFQFGEDFRRLLLNTGSTAGYSGPCWSPWLWFDIDAEGDLERAYREAARLGMTLYGRYKPGDDDLLIFFSGSKGFHVGMPTVLWSPAPSADFAKTARRFAEHAAELATVTIDAGVYDRVRAFRAPNSRHPKTGLHKRRFTLDELTGLSLERIVELSREPAPFDVPEPTGASETAAADWQAAADLVTGEGEAKAVRRAAGNGSPTLNRSTLDYIRNGADQGDRHRLLFSASANLAELGCPSALAVALLEESALDSGLPPKDVRRQIDCGLAVAPSPSLPAPTQQDEPQSTQAAPDGSTVKEPPEAAASDSRGLGGQSCQQLTGATEPASAADLQSELAKLWQSTPAPKIDQGEAVPLPPAPDGRSSPAVLPALPSPLVPLPSEAVGSGTLDKPCKCGSTQYAELPIPGGRTRRDCRKCGRFVGWGRWYDQGGPTR